MSPFVVSIAILAIVSFASADVSHLTGYHYANLGLTTLHTEDAPAPTQHYTTYGGTGLNSLPSSYVPPPSGNVYDSTAAPPTYQGQQKRQSERLSVTLQSPVLAAQKQPTQQYQSQPNYQQYQHARSYQPQQAYQPQPAYGPPPQQTYQAPVQQTYQARAQPQQAYATQPQQTYQTQAQTQAQTQQSYQAQAQVQPRQAYQPQSQAASTSYTSARAHSQEPIITIHFYVHAAPEDPEEEAGPRFVQVGRPRKNYKIIFIRTPSYGLKSQIIPVLPQTEEKTIVYVLSKKPTFDQNVELPEAAPTEPSKPDVFFIKYKTQQEAEQAQQSIQAAYDQANLATDNVSQIGAQFASGGEAGSTFGGQDSTQQLSHGQHGGHYSSTTHTFTTQTLTHTLFGSSPNSHETL